MPGSPPALARTVNPGVSSYLRLVLAYTGDSEVLGKAVRRVRKIGIIDPDILHQPSLMELRASRNQRGDQGRSHAASHIAHEINDSSDRIVLLRCNSDVSH